MRCSACSRAVCQVTTSLGPSERPLLKKKKVKRDEDGILSQLPSRVPAVLDALNYRVEFTDGALQHLAETEGKTVDASVTRAYTSATFLTRGDVTPAHRRVLEAVLQTRPDRRARMREVLPLLPE